MAPGRGLVLLASFCAALSVAGCNELVIFSKRPPQEAIEAAARAALKTHVYVADGVSTGLIAGSIDTLMPTAVASVKVDVPKAACLDKSNPKSCSGLRVTGTVTRKGGVKISGIGSTIVVEIPLAYNLVGVGSGKAKSVRETASGEMLVAASLPLSLDENWRLIATAAPRLDWRSPAKISIGPGSLSIEKQVAASLGKQLVGLRRQLEENVSTVRLRTLSEAAWRQLNTPIGISSETGLWLRGEPISLEFAGLEFADGAVEVRSAIVTELMTFEGDRPLPLIPQKLPPLALSSETPAKPAFVVPVDVSYRAIAEAIMQRLPDEGLLAPRDPKEAELRILGIELFPSRTHLAIGVEIEAKPPDKLEGYKGRAYLVGLPALDTIGGSVRLTKLVMTDTQGAPLAVDGKTLIVDPVRIERLFADQDLIELGETIASARARVSASAEHPVGDGLRLRRRVTDARAGSIALLATALRINVELEGDLTIVYDSATIAVDDANAPPPAGP